MSEKLEAIAIYDVGKTNKKLFLFDRQYKVLHEVSVQIEEKQDEDHFPCDDIEAIRAWIIDSLSGILANPDIQLRAVNFSAYGASLVHVDEHGTVIAPLYNYLKPYPPSLHRRFYDTYGGEKVFALKTASPVLDSLNSGLQLYRLKYEQPELFSRIRYSLHLPEWLSSILSGKYYSGISSIGCHTALWDFQRNNYHEWIHLESMDRVLAPIHPLDQPLEIEWNSHTFKAGVGIHDSSAALIPYLLNFTDPFILISTGTWNISLNPFNHLPLNSYELENDCLCYLQYQGNSVKASRLFAGIDHDRQIERISEFFHVSPHSYTAIGFEKDFLEKGFEERLRNPKGNGQMPIAFGQSEISGFQSFAQAYHHLVLNLVERQAFSTGLILGNDTIKNLFVDGGFSRNPVFMNLLAIAFPKLQVSAAAVPQASAIGAALAIHDSWNESELPKNLIRLQHYASFMDLHK
jgi:sugar (pentulose or hexulose) kinase